MQWFQMYPEFLSNPFYIAGESYAGVYVPTLSHEVVKGIDFSFYTLVPRGPGFEPASLHCTLQG